MPVSAHSTTPLYADWRDRYEVVRRIGGGGFAEVFEARDLQLDEPVALKVVAEGRGMSGRVVREVEAAAALSHPNIVALYDWFGDGEQSYLVWELVDGVSLDQLIGELGDGDVAAVGAELLEALAFAHSQGIIHRDVKPQNVMLDRDGHVKVMDFGIARLLDGDTLTADGDVIGTVAYMSPEQASGRRVGPQSDVYSAGVVLYELLAGRNPLRGETPAETLGNVAGGRLPALAEMRPDVPAELADLVDAACQLAPAQRPTAAELGAALDELVRSGRLGARRLRQAQRLVAPLRRARRGRRARRRRRPGGRHHRRGPGPAAGVPGQLDAAARRRERGRVGGRAAGRPGLAAGRAGLPRLQRVAQPRRRVPAVRRRPVPAHARAGPSWRCGRRWRCCSRLCTSRCWRRRGRPRWAACAARSRPPGPAPPRSRTWCWCAPRAVPSRCTGRAIISPASWAKRAIHSQSSPASPRCVLSPQCLLQMAVWAGLALAVGVIMSTSSLELRLWAWALTFAGVFAAYRIAPVGVWDYAAPLAPLLFDVALAAGMILLLMVLIPTGVLPEERDEEHGLLQVD